MLRKPKSVVGLDLGSTAIKAVELTMDGKEPVLTGFGRVEVGAEGGLDAALQDLFGRDLFRSKRVAVGVAGQSTVVRYLEMVRMSESELRQAIPFELESHLPFEVDEVHYDCQALKRGWHSPGSDDTPQGDAQEGMTVLLAACRKELIEERLRSVGVLGLSPVSVDLDLFALANAWELCGPPGVEAGSERSHEGSTDSGDSPNGEGVLALALVDVGATRTSINVLAGGETCFSREIQLGGADMTQAVARRLGVDGVEAESIKRGAQQGDPQVEGALAPVLEDLAAELSLSVDYVEHHRGVHVEELLLSGGGLLAPGTVAHLDRVASRSVRTWTPLEGLRVDPDRVDVEELEFWAPSLVIALGLAGKVAA